MIGVQIAWLCLLVALATVFGDLTFVNPMLRVVMRVFGASAATTASMTVFVGSLLFHVALSVIVAINYSIGMAVVAISLVAFVWAQVAYLLLQRFAGPLERPGLVMQLPGVLPLGAFLTFVSAALALGIFVAWYWAALPVVVWIALGYVCAEIAIRRYMRRARRVGAECDRGLALFALNEAQGRGAIFGPVRYPFP